MYTCVANVYGHLGCCTSAHSTCTKTVYNNVVAISHVDMFNFSIHLAIVGCI